MAKGRISHAVWLRLYKAYLESSNLQKAAVAAGVNIATATRYIHSGDPDRGIEPIQELIKQKTQHDVSDMHAEFSKHLERVAGISNFALAQHIAVLNTAKLELTGVPDANGKIAVNLTDYGKIVKNVQTIAEVSAKTYDRRAGNNAAPLAAQQVNVNVGAGTGYNMSYADPKHTKTLIKLAAFEQRLLKDDKDNVIKDPTKRTDAAKKKIIHRSLQARAKRTLVKKSKRTE